MTAHDDKSRRRILYMIDDFESEVGGTEQNLLWLLRHLPDSEFEKHFLVFSTVWNCDPEKLPIVPRRLAEEFGFGAKHWPRRLREAARIIRENEIDLVHAVTTSSELASALAIRLAGRARLLANRRDIGYHWTRRGRLVSRFVQWFDPHYIANSEAARQAAHRIEGIDPRRITVIRNPISEKRLRDGSADPLSRRETLPGVPDDAKIVGMLASLRPIKDHPTLFRAARKILRKHPDTFFVLVGDTEGAYRTVLEELARELEIMDRIVWFGPLENPYRILPLMDVAVLSSHSESFSNAVLEYAASGRAIVVSDVGGLGELVRHEKTGLLVPPESPDEMAEAINRLLEDETLRKRLGEEARSFAFREFSESRILEQYVDLYRRWPYP